MNTLLIYFWATLLFASIAWYGFLVFYVGWKAGREIGVMTKTLGAAAAAVDRAEAEQAAADRTRPSR